MIINQLRIFYRFKAIANLTVSLLQRKNSRKDFVAVGNFISNWKASIADEKGRAGWLVRLCWIKVVWWSEIIFLIFVIPNRNCVQCVRAAFFKTQQFCQSETKYDLA